MSRTIVNPRAFGSLVIARVVYAANFYNIAAVFTFIASDLRENVGGLGLLSSGFLLGIGIFQIPSGVFAASWGPRKSAAFGTLLASAAVTLTALAPALVYLVVLRFVVGVGMAFVFGPGIALTARYFKRGSEGLAIGIYNSTFSLGSMVGLSGWVILAQLVGWRSSLLIGGFLGLATGAALLVLVPQDPDPGSFRVTAGDSRMILLDKRLLLVGAGIVGLNAALSLVNNFVVYYLEVAESVAPIYAALVASLSWISNIIVTLVSGRIYDRMKRARPLFLVSAASAFFGMAAIAYPVPYASVLGVILVGSSVGVGSTVAFAVAHEAAKEHPRYEPLAINWVNAIQFVGSFCFTIVFASVVLAFGYELAWLIVGIATLPFVLPILLMKLEHSERSVNRDGQWEKSASDNETSRPKT